MYNVLVSVKQQILRYQSLTTGLYPYDQLHKPTEAHVRDSVYCAAATWALGQAYKYVFIFLTSIKSLRLGASGSERKNWESCKSILLVSAVTTVAGRSNCYSPH